MSNKFVRPNSGMVRVYHPGDLPNRAVAIEHSPSDAWNSNDALAQSAFGLYILSDTVVQISEYKANLRPTAILVFNVMLAHRSEYLKIQEIITNVRSEYDTNSEEVPYENKIRRALGAFSHFGVEAGIGPLINLRPVGPGTTIEGMIRDDVNIIDTR